MRTFGDLAKLVSTVLEVQCMLLRDPMPNRWRFEDLPWPQGSLVQHNSERDCEGPKDYRKGVLLQ